jgi:hypothetical protein
MAIPPLSPRRRDVTHRCRSSDSLVTHIRAIILITHPAQSSRLCSSGVRLWEKVFTWRLCPGRMTPMRPMRFDGVASKNEVHLELLDIDNACTVYNRDFRLALIEPKIHNTLRVQRTRGYDSARWVDLRISTVIFTMGPTHRDCEHRRSVCRQRLNHHPCL